MEIFGTCTPQQSNTNIIVSSSNLLYDQEVAACFTKFDIEGGKEYKMINPSTLGKILDSLQELFLQKFEIHQQQLRQPEVDRNSAKFKFAYREKHLQTVDQTVYIYFANAAHQQLEWLDSYITQLKSSVEKKQQGFIYIMPPEIDKKARAVMGAIRRMGDFSLASFEKAISTFGAEAQEVFKKQGLLREKNGSLTYTHKCLVFYFNDLL